MSSTTPRSCVVPSPAPPPGRRRRPSERLGAVTGLVLAVVGLVVHGAGPGPDPALAAVQHHAGFTATVLGWTSWYGSYALGDLGVGWCIDHGLRAPDPALAYAPTPVADASADTKAAMAWAATMHTAADPVEAAAVMLVLHDLMGARYPFGALQVDRLTTAHLAGFGGQEAALVRRAQAIRAEALAHRHHRAPFALRLAAVLEPGPGPERTGRLVATLTDGAGAPVAGAPVTFKADGARLAADATHTGTDGTAAVELAGGPAAAWFVALAGVPDPALSAFASTTAAAQRVARPAWLAVSAATELAPSTTTTAPPTTTSTTSTAAPPTTTTTAAPPATIPPATTPPTTSAPPTTSVPPTTTTTAAPPASTTIPATTTPGGPPTPTPTAPAPATPAALLPRTGTETIGLVLSAVGLVLLGSASLGARHAWRSRRGGAGLGRTTP